jgi:ribosome biogenesis protein NSA2
MPRRKRIAREPSKRSAKERAMHGLRAKLYHKKRHSEKIEMKKTYALL